MRYLQNPDNRGLEQRRQFGRLVPVDLIERLRPEVAALREPLSLEAGWIGWRRLTRRRKIRQDLDAGLKVPTSPDSPT